MAQVVWPLFFFPIWPRCAAYGILISWAGFKPTPPAVGVWSLNHWTPGKSPCGLFYEGLPHPRRQAHASFAPHPGASPYGEVHSGAYVIFTRLPPPLMSVSLLRAWTMHLSKLLKNNVSRPVICWIFPSCRPPCVSHVMSNPGSNLQSRVTASHGMKTKAQS